MLLSEFVVAIQEEVNKKSLQSSTIYTKMRMALRSLEMKEDWRYMRKVTPFTVTGPTRQIAQPALVKQIDFVRVNGTDDRFYDLVGTTPDKVTALHDGDPTGYYKSGFDYLLFDSIPDRTLTGEIYAAQFTAWPTTPSDSFAPWMLTVCHNLLFYETLIRLGPYLREFELMKTWAELRQDELSTALVSNEEYEYSDQRLYMEYGDGRE